MRGRWLKYLGLLGFLGLLGLVTDNAGFYGFFGFFSFFSYGKRTMDERFEADVNRSARNAFIVSMATFAVGLAAGSLSKNTQVFLWAFALGFAIQVMVFSFSMVYYDRKGNC